MSIFLDPSIQRQPINTYNEVVKAPRNTCAPTGTGACDDCAPVPVDLHHPRDGMGPGGIIVKDTGEVVVPTADSSACSPLQLQKQTADTAFIAKIANEQLNLGGADACFFKLLGVQQQGTLIDAAGKGCAHSYDQLADYPASNAFDRFATYYSTDSSGPSVLEHCWIGYDFGLLETALGTPAYSYQADAENRRHITSFAVKQAGDQTNWVSKVRIERSDDGIRWRGVTVVDLPLDAARHVVHIKPSVPARMWRLRPIEKRGEGRWLVESLELFEFTATDLYNLQDSPLFQENRDRSYCVNPVKIKMHYDLVDIKSELSRFGIDLPSSTMTIQVSFAEAVRQLGRGVIIGDIIEIPSEVQFTADMELVRKFVEVTDVSWSTKGYTPGWVPLFQQITARPMLARQEVQDIIGQLEPDISEGGNGFGEVFFQDQAFRATEQIQIAADTMTPQLGQDDSSIADISEIPQDIIQQTAAVGIDIKKFTVDQTTRYVGDAATTRSAMPPKGTPPELFSIGDQTVGFPTLPKNGQYHRMTYDSVTAEKIPPKLYRFSLAKNRWIYLESDDRYATQTNKTHLKSFLVSDNGINLSDAK